MTLVKLELNPWPIGRSAVASPRVVLGQLIRDATLKRDFLLNIVGLGVSPIIRRCLKKGSMTLGTFVEPATQVHFPSRSYNHMGGIFTLWLQHLDLTLNPYFYTFVHASHNVIH